MLPANAGIGKPMSAMDMLNQMLIDRLNQNTQQQGSLDQEQADQLKNYQNQIQNAGRQDPLTANLHGMASGIDWTGDPQKMLRAGDAAFEANRVENGDRDVKAAGLGYNDVLNRRKDASAEFRDLSLSTRSQMSGLRQNEKIEYRRAADGTTMVLKGGELIGSYGPKDVGKIEQMTRTLAQAAFEKGEYATLDEALDWAKGEASKAVAQMNGSVGNNNVATPDNMKPAVASTPSIDLSLPNGQRFKGSVEDATKAMQQAAASGDFQTAMEFQKTLKAIEGNQVPQAESSASDGSAISKPTMKKKDLYQSNVNEGQGGETGKALGKMQFDIAQVGAEARGILPQIDLLEKLDTVDGMAAGEQGPAIHKIKSSLSSLGVDTGEATKAEDIYNAIASNMALHIRNQGGANLLPGAMSNYEDQLLQKMAPSLSMTKEGRAAMREIMKDMAESNARVADEAIKFQNDNGGKLTTAWLDRANRLGKENAVRMMRRHSEILKPFGIGVQ